MNKVLNIATVFSGIGAAEFALKKMGIKYKILFACDNGEIDLNIDAEKIRKKLELVKDKNNFVKNLYFQTKKNNYVKKAYFANYDIKEENWYEDIRFLDASKYNNKIDLLVGGSPCQSFSIIGKRAGLEDTRGTLFYDYARIIKESQPKVFLYENVLGMLTHDHGNTWKVIKEVFNSLGYKIYTTTLNSLDYGIPQDRKRLFLVGFKNPNVSFSFPKPIKLEKTLFDFLEDDVDAKHYLGKKGFEFVTNPKYRNRARINKPIIQTQKANQQFNWNGDFVFEEYDKICKRKDVLARAYVGTYNQKRGVIRQLSYRECMRLMGFTDEYKIVVPNVPAYRQAGNSIVVNILQALFNEILEGLKKDEKQSN